MRKVYHTLVEIFGGIMGLHPDVISPQTTVTHLRYCDLGAAVIACEKLFHIAIEDEKIHSLENIAQWTYYVKYRIQEEREDHPAVSQAERDRWFCE